ncbi:ketosteroid isomerase-like protein [Natronospira proteinivora]|uniref:Ketosteroid isomerase-like protein n=1 Tax=Natronospira proteinivora TaxID=1807133 RepID=A0ABT1G8J7_9GAMM|nr:nuclear transport factor 2 family protein [Natronospira proteinivora]MCP1727648.1 ketosteroid isomerase-like protein [Natronospira proteinivora]
MQDTETFLRAFNEAFAREDVDTIMSSVTDDIRFRMASETGIEGKPAFEKMLREMSASGCIFNLEIFDVVVAGDRAVVNGEMTLKENKDGPVRAYAFCDLYQLRDGKIAETIAYGMEMGDKP